MKNNDPWDEVSRVLTHTKYRASINLKTDIAIHLVDIRKAIEILKTKFIITPIKEK